MVKGLFVRRRRFIGFLLVSHLLLRVPLPLLAQEEMASSTLLVEEDIEGPSIEPSEGDWSAEGETLKLDIQITDNDKVVTVSLFYRSATQEKFDSLMMQQENNHFSISFRRPEGRALDYYINATDPSGNTTLRGNAAQPLRIYMDRIKQRETLPSEPSIPPLPEIQRESFKPEPLIPLTPKPLEITKKPLWKKWWVWTIVGLVVAAKSIDSVEPPEPNMQ